MIKVHSLIINKNSFNVSSSLKEKKGNREGEKLLPFILEKIEL